MTTDRLNEIPAACPVCRSHLLVTRLQCPNCATEVAGSFALSGLASLSEPHASMIALFLQVRGNVKEMERELGLSYPTVRARVEEALIAAGFGRDNSVRAEEAGALERNEILDELETGTMSAPEALQRLREIRVRSTR